MWTVIRPHILIFSSVGNLVTINLALFVYVYMCGYERPISYTLVSVGSLPH